MDFEIDLGAALTPGEPQGPVVDAEFFVEGPAPLPTFPSGFDLAPVSLSLLPYQKHIALMTQEARSIVVTDGNSLAVAVDAVGRNKEKWKALETARKGFVEPYNAHVKKINNLFHALQDPLLSNEKIINTEQTKFGLLQKQERERREAEAREEQRRLQAQLDAEARAQREEAERKVREANEKLKAEKDEATRAALEKEIADETLAANIPTPQAAPIVIEKPEVVRTAHGSSYMKFKWVCRIIDPDKVARQFCDPSEKKLADFVKGGGRQADGCVIEEVAIPVTRV